MTYRQRAAWQWWLDHEVETPNALMLYVMKAGLEQVRATTMAAGGDPSLIELNDMLLVMPDTAAAKAADTGLPQTYEPGPDGTLVPFKKMGVVAAAAAAGIPPSRAGGRKPPRVALPDGRVVSAEEYARLRQEGKT